MDLQTPSEHVYDALFAPLCDASSPFYQLDYLGKTEPQDIDHVDYFIPNRFDVSAPSHSLTPNVFPEIFIGGRSGSSACAFLGSPSLQRNRTLKPEICINPSLLYATPPDVMDRVCPEEPSDPDAANSGQSNTKQSHDSAPPFVRELPIQENDSKQKTATVSGTASQDPTASVRGRYIRTSTRKATTTTKKDKVTTAAPKRAPTRSWRRSDAKRNAPRRSCSPAEKSSRSSNIEINVGPRRRNRQVEVDISAEARRPLARGSLGTCPYCRPGDVQYGKTMRCHELSRHMATHRPKSIENVCEHCGQVLSRKDSYKRHLFSCPRAPQRH